MSSPIQNLNAFLPASSILQAINAPVKSGPTASTTSARCPFCDGKENTLRVYEDPSDANPALRGAWIHCNSCGWSGDGITFLGEARQQTSVVRLITSLSKDNLLTLPVHMLDSDVAAFYKQTYQLTRANPMKLWDIASKTISKGELTLDTVGPLQDMGLWGGCHPSNWEKYLGKFVGTVSYNDLIATLPDVPIPRGLFEQVIIAPYYDLPGRIRAFRIMVKDHHWHYTLKDIGGANDGGLLGLNELADENDIVYAFGDFISALRVQKKNFSSTLIPLNIVVWAPNTSTAWGNIRYNKIYFWDTEPNVTMFRHMRDRHNALLSVRPAPTSKNWMTYIDNTRRDDFVVCMRENTVSWEQGVKEWLLKKEIDDCVSAVKQLELTMADKNAILAQCNRTEQMMIKERIGDNGEYKSFKFHKWTVVEYPAEWHALDKRGMSTPVTDFRIQFHRTIRHTPTNTFYVEGRLAKGRKDIRFVVSLDTLHRNLTGWVTQLLLENGAGMPYIEPGWDRYLMRLAQKSSGDLPGAESSGRIGIQPDNDSFVFPSFSIQGGKLRRGKAELLVQQENTLPLFGVFPQNVPFDETVWKSWMTPNNACGSFMALSAAILANMIAPRFSQPLRPVGVVGELPGPYSVTSKLVSELRLNTITAASLPDTKGSLRDRIIARANEHAIPTYLDIETLRPIKLAAWAENLKVPVIVNLTHREALSAAMSNDWIFVNVAKTDAADMSRILGVQGILRYLEWLQNEQFLIEPDSEYGFVHAVLLNMQKWIDTLLSPCTEGTYMKARQALSSPGFSHISTPYVGALLFMCDMLFDDSKVICREVGPLDKYSVSGTCVEDAKVAIVEDKQRELVYVSRTRLISALKSNGLIQPNMLELNKSFEVAGRNNADVAAQMGGSGWVIPLSLFAQAAEECKLLRP